MFLSFNRAMFLRIKKKNPVDYVEFYGREYIDAYFVYKPEDFRVLLQRTILR